MDTKATTRTSRRALLAAAGGAAAALAAESLARPLPALGADDNPLIMGQVNTATKMTKLRILAANNLGPLESALEVTTAGLTTAIMGSGHDGVSAYGDRMGLYAYGKETGVEAHSDGGLALLTLGMVSFSTAGFGVVPIGKSSVTITPPNENGEQLDPASSKILVTLLSDPKGVQLSYVKINPAIPLKLVRASFTVYLTATAKSNVRFAYFAFH